MRLHLQTLAAVIAVICGALVIGSMVLLIASTRGDCALTFGRVAFTGRDGLLYTWVYGDETPWTAPVVYFREFTQPTIKWWSFDSGWHRAGWTPAKRVYFVLIPIWVPGLVIAAVGLGCAWYWRRVFRVKYLEVCAGCGYDLRGLSNEKPCPECGAARGAALRS